MVKILLFTLAIIAAGLGYLAFYVGYFKPVTLSETDAGPFSALAADHRGAYHKMAPVISEIEKWAQGHGLKCRLTFGQYFDDPDSVEEARLRSRGGCFLDNGETPPSAPWPEGLALIEIPRRHFVTAAFEGSPGIGPLRVYPALGNYVKEKKLQSTGEGVIEVYEVKGTREMKTIYYFPAGQRYR
ncbi:MAG: AraC family transcriptional regulator [Bdellovibrio sp.]|nr:MAG: AraC family transcriptional regulator [Bdellovibrio sp.]